MYVIKLSTISNLPVSYSFYSSWIAVLFKPLSVLFFGNNFVFRALLILFCCCGRVLLYLSYLILLLFIFNVPSIFCCSYHLIVLWCVSFHFLWLLLCLGNNCLFYQINKCDLDYLSLSLLYLFTTNLTYMKTLHGYQIMLPP